MSDERPELRWADGLPFEGRVVDLADRRAAYLGIGVTDLRVHVVLWDADGRIVDGSYWTPTAMMIPEDDP